MFVGGARGAFIIILMTRGSRARFFVGEFCNPALRSVPPRERATSIIVPMRGRTSLCTLNKEDGPMFVLIRPKRRGRQEENMERVLR